jgi:hypothetical protein
MSCYWHQIQEPPLDVTLMGSLLQLIETSLLKDIFTKYHIIHFRSFVAGRKEKPLEIGLDLPMMPHRSAN